MCKKDRSEYLIREHNGKKNIALEIKNNYLFSNTFLL
jgi:hypothetical protein